ncbi:MAG: helix-turn-helix transcriptional regulator [Candidatus Eremiobacteraeota bacterium]|nr:helix-turn-helix transcriptional regulator [Candidatus Eremiobacteraeota bacterium]
MPIYPLYAPTSSFSAYLMGPTVGGLTIGTIAEASGIGRDRIRAYRYGRRRPMFATALRIGVALRSPKIRLRGIETNEFEALWSAGYRRECVLILGIYVATRPPAEHAALWSCTIFGVLTRGEWPAQTADLEEAIYEFRFGSAAPAERWRVLSTDPNFSIRERWGLV